MAKYTIELRTLIQNNYNIFDDTWSTFDPAHKKELQDKIVRHFWFREIGQETPDRFKHYLNEHLALIMPYYNQLYASEILKLEPLYNSTMETTTERKKKRNESSMLGTRRDISRAKDMAQAMRRTDVDNTIGTGHLNRDVVGKEVRDLDKTEHWDETWNNTRDTTEDETIKETINESRDKNTTDTLDRTIDTTRTDDTTSTEDSTGTSHTTTSNTQRYSDTPQGIITTSGGLSIDAQYLTNYTQNNGSEDVSTTAHKDTTGKLESVGKEVTDTDEKGTENETKDTTRDVKRDLTRNETEKKIGSRDTTGTEDETTNTTQNTTEDTKSTEDFTGKSDTFENGSENEAQKILGVDDRDTKEKEDERQTITRKGVTESQSKLLIEYRNTFLNIDAMIISDLEVEFMGIF